MKIIMSTWTTWTGIQEYKALRSNSCTCHRRGRKKGPAPQAVLNTTFPEYAMHNQLYVVDKEGVGWK
jgi:hypothetical protein